MPEFIKAILLSPLCNRCFSVKDLPGGKCSRKGGKPGQNLPGDFNMKLWIRELEDSYVKLAWESCEQAERYRLYWADKDTRTVRYQCVAETDGTEAVVKKATHVNHYFKVTAVREGAEVTVSQVIRTPVKKVFQEQLEKLSRGLIAAKVPKGIFLSWRLMLNEVNGCSDTGLTGVNFNVYRNGKFLSFVTDSTNYLDREGTMEDLYCVEPVLPDEKDGTAVHKLKELKDVAAVKSREVKAFSSGENYIDLPLKIPAAGVTPSGNSFTYTANDMSAGDVDNDGEYEFIVKWDPTNSKDVSHTGYTGNCIIDCYKLDGTILWRLDMGKNIRAGAHYTQFMVYDFDGDGRAEICVKTAPGTKMTRFGKDGSLESEACITMPEEDRKAGYSHDDDYRCSNDDYVKHLVELFMGWREHKEVKAGRWPDTLEECFGIGPSYSYPLKERDALELVNYFMDEYAPKRNEKNQLRKFEGFIFTGPEYLTMFAGDGGELETIKFPYGRVDDGLLWGDYAMSRIEPCNRVDRFLSGVAYLDGERPYLILCRGYYTRSTVTAYSFFDGHFKKYWGIDSGFLPMANPFQASPHGGQGSDPVYGILAGQGNHSLSTADVDGDGYQEIIYGAAVIDHDGSILYSSYGYLPDGRYAKFGHGDAMHVADIDPDRPGLEIFNVFEGGKSVPYGYALRDAQNGEVIYGEYAEKDLGRCMVGDINPGVRGLETWVTKVRSCTGEVLPDKMPGTNQSIRWAADMSTQILDGTDIFGKHQGVINDNTHGILLMPQDVAVNNGTKGNACLIADIFGDWREELLLRKADNSAIRIFTCTDITSHKLFTLMHDIQYRTAVAWQNNCYNQPGYTKFYFASDIDWKYVLPLMLTAEEFPGEIIAPF